MYTCHLINKNINQLAPKELSKICGGVIPPSAAVQLYNASVEASALISAELAVYNSYISSQDYYDFTVLAMYLGVPVPSWGNVAKNTVNGIFNLNPQLKSVADSIVNKVSAFLNKK